VGIVGERIFLDGGAEAPRTVVPFYLRVLGRGSRRFPDVTTEPFRVAPFFETGFHLLCYVIIQNPAGVSMGQSLEEKTAALIAKDPEFKALVDEHRQLDEKLKELDRKVYPAPPTRKSSGSACRS